MLQHQVWWLLWSIYSCKCINGEASIQSNKVIVPSPHSVLVKFSTFCLVTFLTCNRCYINYINSIEHLSYFPKKKKKQFCWGTWCLLIGMLWALWSFAAPSLCNYNTETIYLFMCLLPCYVNGDWNTSSSRFACWILKFLMDNVSGFCFHFLWENVSRNCSARFVATT